MKTILLIIAITCLIAFIQYDDIYIKIFYGVVCLSFYITWIALSLIEHSKYDID